MRGWLAVSHAQVELFLLSSCRQELKLDAHLVDNLVRSVQQEVPPRGAIELRYAFEGLDECTATTGALRAVWPIHRFSPRRTTSAGGVPSCSPGQFLRSRITGPHMAVPYGFVAVSGIDDSSRGRFPGIGMLAGLSRACLGLHSPLGNRHGTRSRSTAAAQYPARAPRSFARCPGRCTPREGATVDAAAQAALDLGRWPQRLTRNRRAR